MKKSVTVKITTIALCLLILLQLSQTAFFAKGTKEAASIKLNYSRICGKIGKKFTLKHTLTGGTTKSVKYKSSNKKIASVSQKGVVKIKGVGSCKITAATRGGKKARATVVGYKSKPSSVISAINCTSLKPAKTGDKALDAMVKRIIKKHASKGTPYEKVKKLYTYLVKSCSYGNGVMSFPSQDNFYKNQDDAFILENAKSILKTKKGVCDNYAAAFVVLTRALGFDSSVYGGQVKAKGGGYTGHAWSVMKINGALYIFDAQVEDDNSPGNKISYTYFGKTYSSLKGMYKSPKKVAPCTFKIKKTLKAYFADDMLGSSKTSKKIFKVNNKKGTYTKNYPTQVLRTDNPNQTNYTFLAFYDSMDFNFELTAYRYDEESKEYEQFSSCQGGAFGEADLSWNADGYGTYKVIGKIRAGGITIVQTKVYKIQR